MKRRFVDAAPAAVGSNASFGTGTSISSKTTRLRAGAGGCADATSRCNALAATNSNHQGGDTTTTNTKKNWRQLLPIAVGPALLLAGTAAVYTDASSARALTPLAATCMLLMAVQYSVQPRVAKRFIARDVNKKGVALVEELVKTALGLGLLVGTNNANGPQLAAIVSDWSLSSSLVVAGIPATLYALQGVLTYTAYENLDPVTFNGLTQTKMLSAALFCYLLLGRRQSPWQCVALGLLTVSALVFQGTLSLGSWLSSRSNSNSNGDGDSARRPSAPVHASTKDTQTNTETAARRNRNRNRLVWGGIVPCLLATSISGLAGSLSQKGLQLTGADGGRNAFLYTVEVSFFSALCLVVSLVNDWRKGGAKASSSSSTSMSANPTQERRSPLFAHWTPATLLPVVLKAVGGILTALIHKYADSVTKGFALILGLVLTGVVQAAMDEKTLSLDQTAGTALVLLSSWLHFKNPAL